MSKSSGGWERYLPQDRRASLATGAPLPDPAQGAALLADIAGFTPLTTSLVATLGPRRGAEELILQINRVYDALIAEVEKFGGSVIDFAGDAILCWFGATRTGDGVAVATLAAVRAGFALQQAIQRFSRVTLAGGAEVGLSVKVAVASGEARRFVTGDPNIQLLDVLAGRTLDRLGEVASRATIGQVVLDSEAERVIAPLDAARLEVAPPSLIPLDHDAVRPWIPRAIRPHLEQGQEAFLADLRPAVALFILVPGLDYGDARAGARLDELIRWVQARATERDGLLLQVTTGDKGTYLYVVFGAPVAHEDDAIRAVHTALEIRDLPDELAWARGLQIGITRGVMRTGTYGGPTRQAWGVMGNEVNLAARLMMRARPEQILVAAPVAAELRSRFDVHALEPLTLKGVPGPVPVFEILGVAAATVGVTGEWSRAARMVGRAPERARLHAGLEALAAGNGSVSVIIGDPGIGKSHLVHHTLAEARAAGITTLIGAASALERSALYLAWRPVFARLLRLQESPGDAADREEFLARQLEEGEWPLLPLLSAVLPSPLADNGTTATMGGQVRAETTRALLAGILARAAARESLCLAIEDAHWLDSASWALLQRVIASGRTLVLLTSRPVEQGTAPELTQLLATPGIERLDLMALTGEDSLRLACERLGVASVPDEVAALIGERAEGNPFFSEELAFALRDSGVLQIENGRARLAPGARLRDLSLPGNVEGVVSSRIDRLAPSQQLAIKVASVIGRFFAYRTLHDVHPAKTEAAHLREDLSTLARLDLTPVEAEDPELLYTFRHAITREVAYNLMLFAQRQGLHRAVAEWYEQTYPESRSRFLPLLAWHWTQVANDPGASAEVIRTAIARVHEAALQAVQGYANTEASRHLVTELELLARLPAGPARDQEELGIQTMLAYCRMTLAGFGAPEVEQTYRRANELAVEATPSVQLGFILYGLFSFYASRAEYGEAAALADRLLAVGRSVNDSPTLTVGYQSQGIVRLCQGDVAGGLESLRKSTEIASSLGDTALFGYGGDFQVFTGAWIALGEELSGRTDEARATYEAALSRSPNEHFGRAFVLSFAPLAILRRDPAEMLARVAQVNELVAKYGFFLNGLMARFYQGWAVAMQGDAAGGLALMDASLPILRAVKLDSFLPWYLALYAEVQQLNGNHDAALAALDEAGGVVESAGGSFATPEIARVRHAIGA